MLAISVFAVISWCALNCYGEDYKVDFFNQKVDHYNFEFYGNQTFKQRYLYNDSWWVRNKGPIFFFAGHEGPIDEFWDTSAFIIEIAPKFKALVLFVEHRFYGKSFPFGKVKSFESPYIGLLSISQALADYAFFIKAFKKEAKAETCPVIVFGRSYGGQLAAYMRFKYPQIVQGAIASSAPIYQIAGFTFADGFFRVTTEAFRRVSDECVAQVRASFAQIQQWASEGQPGLQRISQTFQLCQPLETDNDYDTFLRWIRTIFSTAATINYPYQVYPNIPALPVKVMCDRLAEEDDAVTGLLSAMDAFLNASRCMECYDIIGSYFKCGEFEGCDFTISFKAFDYQGCTEVNLEGGSDGVQDMFPVLPFTSTMRDDYCQRAWNVTPRRDWLDVLYWGKDLSSSSNIVFSNGDIDPWSAGGVLHNISDTLLAVIIEGGAHHLDLKRSNPADPPSVVRAREFEKKNILMWLKQFYNKNGIFDWNEILNSICEATCFKNKIHLCSATT